MPTERATNIEEEVRRVLGTVLNEVSDELREPDSGGSNGASHAFSSASETPDDEQDDEGEVSITPKIRAAVETLLQELSDEQATALASFFEAIANQDEGDEGGDESGEDDDSEAEPQSSLRSASSFELTSMSQAKSQGHVVAQGGATAIIKLLRKAGPVVYRAAARAARKGRSAFVRWANSLSSLNPLKWAIKSLPSTVMWELIDYLASHMPVAKRVS